MANHPFHGLWRSWAISLLSGKPYEDGTIELDISPTGTYNSGWHVTGAKRNRLQQINVSFTEIALFETEAPYSIYIGHIRPELLGKEKVVAGRYTVPPDDEGRKGDKERKAEAGQDNGIWIATQP